MADKDSGNNQPWLVPVVVAVIGAVSTVVVAWLSRPSPKLSETTPSSSPETLSTNSGNFEVRAVSEEGIPFVNPRDSSTRIRFHSEGAWSTKPGLVESFTSPAGYTSTRFPDYLCGLNADAGALVAKLQDGNCIHVGEEKVITLAPKETIRFYINDSPGLYENNQGLLIVRWSIEN